VLCHDISSPSSSNDLLVNLQGQCVAVQNLSLLQLGGGIRFLLMINMEAVRRVLRATARMAM